MPSPDTSPRRDHNARASAGAEARAHVDRAARPTTRRRGLLIVNPAARRGSEPLDDIVSYMAKRGLNLTLERVSAPERIPEVIVSAGDAVSCVVVCGGDGTLSTALRGILQTGLPLGILPMGTANDLALTLGIPSDLHRAADVILGRRTRRIDIGTVNGHPFFNVASLGLSVRLADNLCRDSKRRWGRLSYVRAALRALLQSRPFPALITADGKTTRVRTLQIAVGNGRHYGGGNAVATNAAIDDGQLDLYSLEVRSAWRLVLMAPAFRAGSHGNWQGVRTARSTAFDVTTRTPQVVTADGERIAHTPARFRLLPRAVQVYVP